MLYKQIQLSHWATIQNRYQHILSDVEDVAVTSSYLLPAKEVGFVNALFAPEISKIVGKPVSVKKCIMFGQRAGAVQLIHVDGSDPERKHDASWSVNIPIVGYGRMKWYLGDFELTQQRDGQNLGYLQLNWKTEPTQFDSFVIDKPTIVKIDVPHQVVNETDQRRSVLCLRFSPDLY